MYMLTIKIKRADPTGVSLLSESRRPQSASDALASAMEALDNGWNFEIRDLNAGRNINLTELRNAAQS